MVGNHLEMSRSPGLDYPTGSTFQPDEPPLPLRGAALQKLHHDWQALGHPPTRRVADAFSSEPK